MGTLRRRIVASFVAFAVLVAAVSGLAAAVLLYSIEDEFFDVLLREEARLLETAHGTTGTWGAAHYGWMTVYRDAASLPDDLRAQLRAEPARREFRGRAGRHYHVRVLRAPPSGAATRAPDAPAAWLVAEVAQQLVLRANRAVLLRSWAGVALGTLAFAVLLAALVGRRVSRPLSQLADSLRAVDPAGDAPMRPVIARDAEIATVVAAIDGLRQRVAGFVAREQAFTRDVSHELRNPLAVVRSTATRLAGAAGQTDDGRRALLRILGACDRLEWTMRSLLELARERERAGSPQPLRLRPVLEEVIVEFDEALRDGRLEPVLELPPDFALPIDRAVLYIVLGNLLGNACHHAAPGTLRIRSDGAALWVENPIPTEVDAAAADAPPATVRRADRPGHGLGLGISQRLCERSALSLTWETRATVFVVRLGTGAHDACSDPAIHRRIAAHRDA